MKEKKSKIGSSGKSRKTVKRRASKSAAPRRKSSRKKNDKNQKALDGTGTGLRIHSDKEIDDGTT